MATRGKAPEIASLGRKILETQEQLRNRRRRASPRERKQITLKIRRLQNIYEGINLLWGAKTCPR